MKQRTCIIIFWFNNWAQKWVLSYVCPHWFIPGCALSWESEWRSRSLKLLRCLRMKQDLALSHFDLTTVHDGSCSWFVKYSKDEMRNTDKKQEKVARRKTGSRTLFQCPPTFTRMKFMSIISNHKRLGSVFVSARFMSGTRITCIYSGSFIDIMSANLENWIKGYECMNKYAKSSY